MLKIVEHNDNATYLLKPHKSEYRNPNIKPNNNPTCSSKCLTKSTIDELKPYATKLIHTPSSHVRE